MPPVLLLSCSEAWSLLSNTLVSTHKDALSGLQKIDKLIQSVGHYHRTKESTYFTSSSCLF